MMPARRSERDFSVSELKQTEIGEKKRRKKIDFRSCRFEHLVTREKPVAMVM